MHRFMVEGADILGGDAFEGGDVLEGVDAFDGGDVLEGGDAFDGGDGSGEGETLCLSNMTKT